MQESYALRAYVYGDFNWFNYGAFNAKDGAKWHYENRVDAQRLSGGLDEAYAMRVIPSVGGSNRFEYGAFISCNGWYWHFVQPQQLRLSAEVPSYADGTGVTNRVHYQVRMVVYTVTLCRLTRVFNAQKG